MYQWGSFGSQHARPSSADKPLWTQSNTLCVLVVPPMDKVSLYTRIRTKSKKWLPRILECCLEGRADLCWFSWAALPDAMLGLLDFYLQFRKNLHGTSMLCRSSQCGIYEEPI